MKFSALVFVAAFATRVSSQDAGPEEKISYLRYSDDSDQCLDLKDKGYDVYQTPKCALVKALLDGVPLQSIIFTSSPEQVQGVCKCSPSCVGQLDYIIKKAERMGCSTDEIYTSEGTITLEDYKEFSVDISKLQRFLCTDDCFEESKLFYTGAVSNMSCECLIGARNLSYNLSSDAKAFIGMDDEFDSNIDSAIGSKQCKMRLQNSLEEA